MNLYSATHLHPRGNLHRQLNPPIYTFWDIGGKTQSQREHANSTQTEINCLHPCVTYLKFIPHNSMPLVICSLKQKKNNVEGVSFIASYAPFLNHLFIMNLKKE